MKFHSLIINRVFNAILFFFIIILSYYVSVNWYQLSLIRGESMSPAYHNMQLVIIDRHSRNYSYGDVITFKCGGLNFALVKRIVACPGDIVLIKDGTLFVNDAISEVFPQEYIFEFVGIAASPIFLEDNEYFVIGDNLEESKDSRYTEVGIVHEDDILGKVFPNVTCSSELRAIQVK